MLKMRVNGLLTIPYDLVAVLNLETFLTFSTILNDVGLKLHPTIRKNSLITVIATCDASLKIRYG
jgi:hypothetical protein